MDDKLMYILNDDIQNYPFHLLRYYMKSLDTASMNQLINEKLVYKTLGTNQCPPNSLLLSYQGINNMA